MHRDSFGDAGVVSGDFEKMKLVPVPEEIPISTFSPNFSILIQGLVATHFCSSPPRKKRGKN